VKKQAAKAPVHAVAKPKSAAKAAPASSKVKQPGVGVTPKAASRPASQPAAAKAAPLRPAKPAPRPAPVAAPVAAAATIDRTGKPSPDRAPAAPSPAIPAPEPEAPPAAAAAAAGPKPEELRRVPAAPAPRGFATMMGRPTPGGPNAPGRPTIGPPPRAPAPAEIFVEGDHVVYPTHGVGKIERIVTENIAGYHLELIHITFEENRMTLRVPVEKARSAGLRKLASRQLFDAALTTLKGRARIKRTMWSRRAQEYEAKINSGDPLAIAEVVRDLHRNAGQPDQSFSERQIYEAAMDRLAAELAALDNTDKATATEKLTTFLKTA